MCGIVGFSGTCAIEALDAGLGALSHRGPDGNGVWYAEDARAGLAHARLAIIDLSPTGAQPMASDAGDVVLVFNGEIYNYQELRQDLLDRGVSFRGASDTEVLLRLYLADGLAMLPRLNGIFAFALFDRRQNELLLVRDGYGVKPLYWSEGPQGVIFASEIKSLLAMGGCDGALDAAALERYVTFLWCPGTGTPLTNVRKVEPGEWIRVRDGLLVARERWYTQPMLRVSPILDLTAAEAVASVRNGLRAAVHRQLVADVPVGAFLSGGLDSSAVVAFARERSPDIRCFTITSPGGGDAGDAADLPYAQRVAKHLGVRLDVVEVSAERMAAGVERMVWQLDEPLADPASLNVFFISELARAEGIKVLLSGAGGDDLFTGYRRHLAVAQQGWLGWLPGFARRGLAGAANRVDQRTALGRRAAKLFLGADRDGDERLAAWFAWAPADAVRALFSAELRAALAATRPEQPMLDFLAGMPAERDALDRMLALEQRFFLADHNLLYTDKMAMAAGVEVRVPFLDMELVELAATLPHRLKQRGWQGKWVLKKAMEADLPEDVIYRPKTGFGAPLRRWLRHELRDLLRDTLSEESLRRRGLFDTTAVHALIDDNDSGRRDAAYPLFALLCIELWCRQFIDRASLGASAHFDAATTRIKS